MNEEQKQIEKEQEDMPQFVGAVLGSLYIKQRVPAFDTIPGSEGGLFLTDDPSKNWKGDEGVCFIPIAHTVTKEFYKDRVRIHVGVGGHCNFHQELCLICKDHPPICSKCIHNSSNPFSDECYNVFQILGLLLESTDGKASFKDLETLPTVVRIPFKRMTLQGFNQVETIQVGLLMKGLPNYGAIMRYRTSLRKTTKGMSAYVPQIVLERILNKEEIEIIGRIKDIFKRGLDAIPIERQLEAADATRTLPVVGEGERIVDPLDLII